MRRLALAAALAAMPSLAAAQLVDATSPGRIAEFLQEAGYRATLSKDSAGDPMIKSALEGSDFIVQFFGCTENRNCKYLVFRVIFPGGGTLEEMNGWNVEELVGTAYLDEDGDPGLDYFVSLDGGVSRENLLDVIDWWRVAMTKFKQHIQ